MSGLYRDMANPGGGEHFRAGLQPFGFSVVLTQPFGLGWDMAAPLALNKTTAAGGQMDCQPEQTADPLRG